MVKTLFQSLIVSEPISRHWSHSGRRMTLTRLALVISLSLRISKQRLYGVREAINYLTSRLLVSLPKSKYSWGSLRSSTIRRGTRRSRSQKWTVQGLGQSCFRRRACLRQSRLPTSWAWITIGTPGSVCRTTRLS